MKVNIEYCLESFHETAKFIWDNNPHVTRWPELPQSVFDVMRVMQHHMHRGVRKNVTILEQEKALGVQLNSGWIHLTGIGGFCISFFLENQTEELITISVDFLVDPGVGTNDRTYVTEELDDDTEFV